MRRRKMGLVESKVQKYLDTIERDNKKVNAILHINPNAIEEAKAIDAKKKKGRLYGYVFAVKSNINVKDMIVNCASHVLENYVAPYDATVVKKIKDEDAVIIGMANMDEFAAGGSGEKSAFGCAANPAASGRIPGGSSSGSASAVAAGFCDVALGSDTGGSIRNPASNCGVVGVKPSYGLVSRYGLIDLSMSLDQIGPLGTKIDDVALVLDVIRGKDSQDTKTFDSNPIKISEPKKIKIGVLHIKNVDKKIEKLIDDKVSEITKKLKWDVKKVEVKHIDLAVQTYYPLVYVEFFSGTRRFDGRRYGKKIETVCGPEVYRRIIGGQEITKAEHKGRYYNKALEVKEVIKEEFESVFSDVDCIILPTVPRLPWKIGDGAKMTTEEDYAYDSCTVPANLAELCALSIPAGKIDNIPIGMQIFCAKGEESKMLSIAKMIEEI